MSLGPGDMCTPIFAKFGDYLPNTDSSTIADLADSFSFSEVQKGPYTPDYAQSFVTPLATRAICLTPEVLSSQWVG